MELVKPDWVTFVKHIMQLLWPYCQKKKWEGFVKNRHVNKYYAKIPWCLTTKFVYFMAIKSS